MKLNRENRKWILILVAISLLMVWTMQRIEFIPEFISQSIGFFSPLLIGIFIAFVVNLPMRFIENLLFSVKWKKYDDLRENLKRPVSMILSFAILIGIIVALLFLVLPDLVDTVVSFSTQLPQSITSFQSWVSSVDASDNEIINWLSTSSFSINNLMQRMINWLNNGLSNVASSAFAWISKLFSGFMNFFFGLVFSIYFLLQKEKIAKQAKQLSYAIFPEHAVDRVLQLGHLVNNVFSGFISGQGFEALILGFLNFLGMQIFGFPYPLTISVMIVIGALIPIFGAVISAALGALLIMVQSPLMALTYMIMIIIIQQIEGNFIYPRVVGKSVGLPALWVLFAVMFGSKLFGFMGLLLSVPTFSVIYILLRSWSRVKVQEKNISKYKLESHAYVKKQDINQDFFADEAKETSVFSKKTLREVKKDAEHALAKDEFAEKKVVDDAAKIRFEEKLQSNVRPSNIKIDLNRFEEELEEEFLEAKRIRHRSWQRTFDLLKRKKAERKSEKD